MGYDPLGYFQAGQKVGASKNAGFTKGTETVMDAFKAQSERRGKFDDALALEKAKNNLPLNKKDQAQADYYNAQSNFLKNAGSSGQEADLQSIATQAGMSPEDYIQNPTVTRFRGKMQVENAPKLKDPLDAKSTNQIGLMRSTRQNLTNNLGLMKNKGVESRMSPFSFGATRMPGSNMLLRSESMMGDKSANDFLTFKAETDKVFQQFRKETTGAQAALQELGWLEPDYPMPTDPPDVYRNKAMEALKRFEQGENMLLDLYSQRGYRVGDLRKGMNPLQQASGNPKISWEHGSGGYTRSYPAKRVRENISEGDWIVLPTEPEKKVDIGSLEYKIVVDNSEANKLMAETIDLSEKLQNSLNRLKKALDAAGFVEINIEGIL